LILSDLPVHREIHHEGPLYVNPLDIGTLRVALENFENLDPLTKTPIFDNLAEVLTTLV
jgi:hypothetical protein